MNGRDDDDEISGVFEPSVVEDLPAGDPAHIVAGRYEIVERIGAGGMGQVLRVRHRRLGKPFALKLMQADFIVEPEARQVFDREARLASALAHPNIVSIVDFGEDPDWGLFIVMEYLEGESLAHRIEQRGSLPVDVVCHVGAQLVSAIRHSHDRGVVHGDLKSDNVLCVHTPEHERRGWEIKLLDFGMAHVAGAAAHGRLGGTPEYLAPERIRGDAPGPSMDLYALGILLYEMLTGAVPFSGADPQQTLQRQLTEAPAPIAARRAEPVDDALAAIVDRALAKDPAHRYASAAAMAEDLFGHMRKRGMRSRTVGRRPTTAPGDTRVDAAAAAFVELPVPAAGLASDGTIVVANRAMARLLGAPDPEALEGESMLSTALCHLHPTIRDDLRLVAMDGKIVRRNVQLVRADRTTYMRVLMTPTRGPCGHCVIALHGAGSHKP